jgi:hypothetical protein
VGLADGNNPVVGGVFGAAAAAVAKAEVSPGQLTLLQHTSADVSNRYLLAKTYFDIGEFQRCVFVLLPTNEEAAGGDRSGALLRSPSVGSQLRGLAPEELFLKAYALYLAGEKAKEQEALETRDPLDRSLSINPNLKSLKTELTELYLEGGLDAFGLYIFGVVLKELKIPVGTSSSQQQKSSGGMEVGVGVGPVANAYTVLSESCAKFPWNWSAWTDLAEVCVENEQTCAPEDVHSSTSNYYSSGHATTTRSGGGGGVDGVGDAGMTDPAPWCREFFVAHTLMELGGAGECEDALKRLVGLRERLFPFSTYLLGQVGWVSASLSSFVVD